MERDVNQYVQRNILMGSLSPRRSCECRVWHSGDSTLKAASGSKSPVTPSHNGQLIESAYLRPRVMQTIARGSRSPFILRVDVFALSPSLHSNLLLPDRAGPLLRAARTWSSQVSRFDLHERTLPRLKSILPVKSLQDGSEAKQSREVIGF